MQSITLSQYLLATNDYMWSFLNRLASGTTPSIKTVIHHLAEMYNSVIREQR